MNYELHFMSYELNFMSYELHFMSYISVKSHTATFLTIMLILLV